MLRIPFLNHLLDGDLCKKLLDFHSFSYLVFNHDFIICIDIAPSNTALMMSQIRSDIEYLIRSYDISVLILYARLMKNLASLTDFNTI